MSFSITPEVPLYNDVYQRLLGALPNSSAYLRAPVTIPYSPNPQAFTLTTTSYGPINGRVHRIFVNGVQQTGLIPDRATTRVLLTITPQLTPTAPRPGAGGFAEIVVDDGVEWFTLPLVTTNIATLLAGAAKELYLSARRTIDDNAAALASPFSSRLVEHLLAFQDLLPSNRAPRIQAVKMAIKQMVSGFGTERGVKDFVTALVYSTPHLKELRNSGTTFDPRVYPVYRRQHDWAGFEFHVWFPNLCTFTWLAFTQLADNVRKPYQLKTVSENQVVLLYNGAEARHVFDSDAEACLDSLGQLLSCFDNIRSYIQTEILSDYGLCEAAYPFDVLVEEPLGIGLLDTGLFDDPGGTFDDDVDELDPLWNGYEGESLVDRFDGVPPHCFDSFGATTRQQDIDCCWPGAAMGTFWHNDTDLEILALP